MITKINLNEASVEELTQVAGVGRITAQKIVDYRNKMGKISSYDELKNISDIDGMMFRKIIEESIL
jgi:competence protein ComEA